MSKLPEIAQALLNSGAYPDSPQGMELKQTQMSFVFLAGEHVYKIKKPVDLGYLDYTTLEKRHYYCQRELELNRRLCPGAYLGIVPVVRSRGGILVGGQGEVLEYAVKMRRLPQERMLDVLLRQGKVAPEMLAGVAQKIAAFHHQRMHSR